MARLRPLVPIALLILAVSFPATAAVRLTTSVNGTITEVEWPAQAFPLRYKTDDRLLAALPGGPAMIDRALTAWSAVPNARVAFQSTGTGSGLKAGHDGQNVITLADDLFANQRAIAVTTNWDVKGQITESDIQIDSTIFTAGYNIQQAITHEVGHLLGLDHSGVLSAVMYPFVSRGTEDVSTDSDDRIGLAAIYPEVTGGLVGGVLRGRVLGDTGGIFAAQVVAVNERGEPVSSALTNDGGEFTLTGMPDGAYRIYAEPLDGPVDTKNLSPYWRQAKATSFPTQFHSETIRVSSGNVYGNLIVTTAGAVDLNPRWVAASTAGSSDFRLSSSAVTIKAGQTFSIAVAGDGMISGVTTFEVLSPGIRRVSDFRYAGNYVSADWQIPGDTQTGSVVILVKRGNDSAALTGAVRIVGAGATTRGRIARR